MLIVLTRNIARNRRRRHDYARPHVALDASIEQIASDARSADELISAAERHALMLACIATFGDMQRAVVRLRLLDEVSGESVARQLGLTPEHVAVLLFPGQTGAAALPGRPADIRFGFRSAERIASFPARSGPAS